MRPWPIGVQKKVIWTVKRPNTRSPKDEFILLPKKRKLMGSGGGVDNTFQWPKGFLFLFVKGNTLFGIWLQMAERGSKVGIIENGISAQPLIQVAWRWDAGALQWSDVSDGWWWWTCTTAHLGHQEWIQFLGYVVNGAKILTAKVRFHRRTYELAVRASFLHK